MLRISGNRPQNGVSGFANYMGVSENSVPLYPMVNDHYPY